MRKVAAAVLAAPVLTAIYAPLIFRRRVAVRAGLAVVFGCLVLVTALGVLPRQTSAVPASTSAPLPEARFGPAVAADLALDRAVTVDFSAAMDRSSVARAFSVSPATKVTLSWQAGDARLVVQPVGSWLPDTYYTVTIGATARDATGNALGSPLRAGFLTRRATTATIAASKTTGSVASVRSAITVTFDEPVQASSARSAFEISPAVAGTITFDSASAPRVLTFQPDAALAAGTTYTVTLAGAVSDDEGGAVVPPSALTVRTEAGPRVVRFRPFNGTTAVSRAALLSVRFTQAMNRTATAAAFTVTAGGTKVSGTTSWAEGDTVLVFRPKGQLPAGTKVVMTVGPSAAATTGAAIGASASGTFTTVAAPKPVAKRTIPKAAPKPAPRTTPIPKPGTTAGSSAWLAVERYYLNLMNCTRGGGLVTSTGACSSPGGSGIRPLWIDSGISSKVSRPYAKLLATTGVCSHFYGSNPGQRLARAGYTSYKWAENLGCRDTSNLYASALGTQLYFQSERLWSPPGGHWVNMMNPLYDRVGIGLWAANGNVRLVIDFYHP